jgi:hypothetical protein
MSYDPSQNVARLAALQQRAQTTYPSQGGAFQLTSVPTTLLAGDHPAQLWLAPSRTGPRVVVRWSATYRATQLRGYSLVVDQGQAAVGQAAALQSAEDAFNGLDQRLLRLGQGSGPFGVLPGQVVSRPYYSPGPDVVGAGARVPGGQSLQGDARWVNAPKR